MCVLRCTHSPHTRTRSHTHTHTQIQGRRLMSIAMATSPAISSLFAIQVQRCIREPPFGGSHHAILGWFAQVLRDRDEAAARHDTQSVKHYESMLRVADVQIDTESHACYQFPHGSQVSVWMVLLASYCYETEVNTLISLLQYTDVLRRVPYEERSHGSSSPPQYFELNLVTAIVRTSKHLLRNADHNILDAVVQRWRNQGLDTAEIAALLSENCPEPLLHQLIRHHWSASKMVNLVRSCELDPMIADSHGKSLLQALLSFPTFNNFDSDARPEAQPLYLTELLLVEFPLDFVGSHFVLVQEDRSTNVHAEVWVTHQYRKHTQVLHWQPHVLFIVGDEIHEERNSRHTVFRCQSTHTSGVHDTLDQHPCWLPLRVEDHSRTQRNSYQHNDGRPRYPCALVHWRQMLQLTIASTDAQLHTIGEWMHTTLGTNASALVNDFWGFAHETHVLRNKY